MKLTEQTFADPAMMFSSAADLIGKELIEAVRERGKAVLAVSGGKTPEPLFNLLSEMSLPWHLISVILVDERFVPADHADSNAALVCKALIKSSAEKASFIPMYLDNTSIEQCALLFDEQFRELGGVVDVVVLGMGEDGHTASWFPDCAQIDALIDPLNPRFCAPSEPTAAPHKRLTLTLPAFLKSRVVTLLVTGEKKRQVYLEARQTAEPVNGLPVRAVLHQRRVATHVFRA